MTSPEIRKPAPQDARAIYELTEDFATSFAPEWDSFEKIVNVLVADSDVDLLGAFDSSQMTGYVLAFSHPTFFANGTVTWVEEIYVAPDHRRKGIATALMGSVEGLARANGAKLVALATRRAAAFYESLGYEESAVYFRRLLD